MLDKTLDLIRIALYAVLLVLGLFLYQAWNREHLSQSAVTSTTQNSGVDSPTTAGSDRFVPQVSAKSSATTASNPASNPAIPSASVATGTLVTIMTDVMQATIDTHGGDIIEVRLLKYPEELHSSTPFELLNNKEKTRYLAQSGLLSKMGPDSTIDQGVYTVSQTAYQLMPGQAALSVVLNWKKDGININKIFTFTRNSYEVKVGYDIQNTGTEIWEGNFYTQLVRTDVPPPSSGGFVNLATYFGAALSTPAKPFEKISFKQMQEKNISQEIKNGWVAMVQHYFIGAWVPPANADFTYYSRVLQNQGLYTIGMIGSPLKVMPHSNAFTEAKLYIGPAIAHLLEKTAPSLKLTIDYGWFWFISDIIFWLLEKIYNVVGNWGWSIVLVTILIKILFYQLSAKSYRSMSGLKRLQPKIEALKERYADDRQKLTQATLELYKQEKVNPMSGCLPVLIQIPVFIALYWVLVESVQLRQAPFILWIRDLSQQDPYYILPVLMGISMYIQQRLNPPPPDPMQAKIMMLMPLIFTVLFANFPAGLMLYWFVNNTLSFMQQWYVMYKMEQETKKTHENAI